MRGLRVRGYVVEDLLGSGRVGLLYLASHEVTGRRAILRFASANEGEEVEIFVKEAKSLLPSAEGAELLRATLPDGRRVHIVISGDEGGYEAPRAVGGGAGARAQSGSEAPTHVGPMPAPPRRARAEPLLLTHRRAAEAVRPWDETQAHRPWRWVGAIAALLSMFFLGAGGAVLWVERSAARAASQAASRAGAPAPPLPVEARPPLPARAESEAVTAAPPPAPPKTAAAPALAPSQATAPRVPPAEPRTQAVAVPDAPDACRFGDRYRDWARRRVQDLRELAKKNRVDADAQGYAALEDEVSVAMSGKDCARANRALAGLRRLAGERDE
jgi:hypothetical protein